jgi:diguanylate cyclase (GGDEF)-like protein
MGELHEVEERQATRFGGDEYQTLLPGLSNEGALEVAEEIRRRVEYHAFEQEGVSASPTFSFGVATYPEDGTTPDALTRAADKALYRAKRSDGNTVCD